MKKTILLIFCCLCIAGICRSQTVRDDFNDNAIDTTVWAVFTPFGSSQVSEAAGRAIFIGRGGLDTLASYPGAVEIKGRFRFAGSLDNFQVHLRSDLSLVGQFADKGGTTILFDQENNIVRIAASDGGFLASRAFAFQANTDVDFRITDDGSTVNVYVGDLVNPYLTGQTSVRQGNKLAFYNREFSFCRVEIDFLQIDGPPTCDELLAAGLDRITQTLQAVWPKKPFEIPGNAPLEKFESLVKAIEDLNHGQKVALRANLESQQ